MTQIVQKYVYNLFGISANNRSDLTVWIENLESGPWYTILADYLHSRNFG